MPKIGDTLYRFDVNCRKHGTDGRSIYAKHFRPGVITGETPRSWLIREYSHYEIKVSKKGLKEAGKNGFSGYQWFTEEGMRDDVWKNDNGLRIAREVQFSSASVLREVDALLKRTGKS